jgi:SNF2 family DNA or RNA helicase
VPSNQIALQFNRIRLTVADPKLWFATKFLTGKVTEVSPGIFEMALSTHNLKRIAEFFPPDQKPTVVSGRGFLDSLKSRLDHYKLRRSKMQEVISKERYPLEPNGKFVPYSHQTVIVGTVDANTEGAILTDCGTGKTGATARSMERIIQRGEINRGKILVSAPLSILHTSWFDDITQFTDLRPAILWAPMPNKNLLGDQETVFKDYGEKPPGTITTESKTGVIYFNPTQSRLLDESKPNALDGTGWVKYQGKWKVAIDINGVKTRFGPLRGRTLDKEDTREDFIREQLKRTDVDLYLINHDGVRIYEDVLKSHNFEWVVVDESTKIKSPTSKVSHAHVAISWKAKRRNILSGTPNPNGFIDLWHQFYFLDRGMTLEPCLKDFLYEYFKPEIVGFVKTPGGKKQAVKYVLKDDRSRDALVARVRSVSICLEQRDCVDLPPRTDTRRVVYMNPEQERAYDSMARDLVAELHDIETGKSVKSDAVNVLSKIMKLRQITSGFLMNREGDMNVLSTNPKWEDLDDYIEELNGKKVVIACQFRAEIDHLLKRYERFGGNAIFGGVTVEERARIIRDFQETDRCKVILLQPQAAAHGITLTAASHLAFASLDYNFEFYYQVAKRIERIGQKNPIFVTHSIARYADGDPTIDEDLFDVLHEKSKDRSSLFNPNDALNEIANRLTQQLKQQVEKRNVRRKR